MTGASAYPGTDDGLPPLLSLHLNGTVFQSTFNWPVFTELRRQLRARQDGDRTRSYQGRHVSPRCTAICDRRSNAILSDLPYS